MARTKQAPTEPTAPTEPAAKVSLVEVAKASGVSVATVSRVLSGFAGVNEETAEQVREAVRKLEYRPLRVRRKEPEFKRDPKSTGNLAVVTIGKAGNWLQLPVLAAAVDGIRQATDALGYRLMIGEVQDPARPGALFDNKEVDGALAFASSVYDPRKVAEALRLLHKRLPVVWVMGGALAVDVDHVHPDHFRIGQLAYEYLRNKGCREVAYVTTRPRWPLMQVRAHGFTVSAFDAARPTRCYVIDNDPVWAGSYGPGAVTAANPLHLVGHLAAAKPAIDGVFIATDQMTTTLYPLLSRAGLRPGENLTVVSCDNEEARLSGLDPRPATIDVGAHDVGRRAVAQLLARMQHPDLPPVAISVTPRLVEPV